MLVEYGVCAVRDREQEKHLGYGITLFSQPAKDKHRLLQELLRLFRILVARADLVLKTKPSHVL